MIGTSLGRYRIVRRLGAGGMGEVYEAEDPALARTVALKVLMPGLAGDLSRRSRFEREARAVAALTHPNIVTIHSVEESEGQLFLVMERVKGSTLAELLPAEGFSFERVIELALPLCSAIAEAHARGIVHRDLKPQNVMVTNEGQLKVLDFGIARQLETLASSTGAAATQTATGAILGTVAYMSPEQAQGRAVEATSDVFSLGIVLFELATGRRPFAGESLVALGMAIVQDPAPTPSSVRPGLPRAFDDLVLRCLEKAPARRPATAGELERALRALRSTTESETAPAPAPSPVTSRPRLRRLAPVAALIALGAALAALLLSARRPPRDLPSAPSASPSAVAPVTSGGVTVSDLPPPRSSSREALAAYAAGMQTWRDGSIDRAAAFFEQALQRDPGMGAAYLRVALRSPHTPGERAVFFKEAVDRRASLEAHEAALLDAFAPCFQGRSGDDRWCVGRAAEAARRAPEDAELAFWAAKTLLDAGRFDEAVRGFDRALALDAGFGLAWVVRIHTLSYLGDFDEAERSIQRCMAVSPSDRCVGSRGKLDKALGRCVGLEGTARAMLGLDPGSFVGLLYLTHAQAGQGLSSGVVKTTAEQIPEAFPPFARAARRLWVAQKLAESRGDFAAASSLLAEREKALGGSNEQVVHAELIEARIAIDTEIARPAAAGAAARAYLDKRGALSSTGTDDDIRMRAETPGFALLAARRAGLITRAELRAERDRFVALWRPRLGPGYLPFLWLDAYAVTVDDEDDAREALDALPSFGGLPRFFYYDPLQDRVGLTFLLAGRVDEAIPWLEGGARACELPFVTRPIAARLLLGEAREQKGEKGAACAAYAEVLKRWGSATPRSVTAEEARRRAKALGCR
jgi:serine/threonine-protein kinase